MGYLARKSISSIQPRVKPPKPIEAQTVPCPFPEQWGPGLEQTRVCTFNYGLPFQWECTPWQTVGGQCTAVPPRPAEQQTLPCPEGQVGTGIQQERVCTFDYVNGVWNCTAWDTISEDCAPAIIPFVTASQPFVPQLSGTGITDESEEQLYSPPPVAAGGYTMTLTYHVYAFDTSGSGDLVRRSDLTVAFSPAPTGTLQVQWDRDYATFVTKAADPSGTTTWLAVPCSEWTANDTQFTITLTP